MNLIPFVTGWAVLALFVLALALYRWIVAANEDDSLHVADGEQQLVAQQAEMAVKLQWIDKWGVALTVATLLIGIVLAGLYIYQSWLMNNAWPIPSP